MINSINVECKKCNSEFTITTLAGKLIGNYYCPQCGTRYEKEQGNDDE